MRHRRITSTRQASFLETLLLGSGTETPSVEPLEALTTTPVENYPPSTVSPSPDEMADLFDFISALAQSTPTTAPFRTHHKASLETSVEGKATQPGTENQERTASAPREGELEVILRKQEESQSPFLPIVPEWLFQHQPDLLTRIAAIWNSMRECEGLTSLENAERILAPQLVHSLSGSRTHAETGKSLLDCCRDLETLAQRLYGDVTHQANEEISRCVNTMMEHAPRQSYENEEIWIRHVMEAAVQKVLVGHSNSIYPALVLSTLQRPFRDIVRHSLQANELPFPERVLAHAREKGYANTMRESLQTLSRLGLTAQTTMLAWEAAHSGQTQITESTPWIAQRVDGCTVATFEGHAIVDQRVIRFPGYTLLATFDAENRVTRQMTIATPALEQAKQFLWAQGYRGEEEGFALPDHVVKLWGDFCSGRDNGWWYCDMAGRIMVVIPYVLRRRLSYHKPLCRAVAQMQTWGYRFHYDDHTMYFLPAGVDLPVNALNPKEETAKEGEE